MCDGSPRPEGAALSLPGGGHPAEEDRPMSYFSKRALRWAAPVALVGALVLAACGNDDTEAVTVAAPTVAGFGSDQHLSNMSGELARVSASAGSDQHLANRASQLSREQRSYKAASDRLTAQAEQYERAVQAGSELSREQRSYKAASDRLTAQAEQYERAVQAGNRAALKAQAESYVQQQQDRAESTRAVQMTEAPAYVWQQQHRADGSSDGNDSYDDDFLPGSRHVPTR